MTTRFLTSVSAASAAAVLLMLAAKPGPAQAPVTKAPATKAPAAKSATPAKSTWTPPRTPWGDPDIQGQWPAAANIPMQRPANLGDRTTLTDEEIAARQKQLEQQDEADQVEVPTTKVVTINPPGYWLERGKPDKQAAMVVDPPDGRIPPLTPAARDFAASIRGGLGPGQHYPNKVDTFEDFDIYSRCITRGLISSMLPTLYNFGNDIIQSPGYVAIRNEMIHETRVIPLDKHPHVGKGIRTYMGDARGHWEGNTLVVETTNLNDKTGSSGGYFSDVATLTERFTRTSPTELSYDLTVNDPKTWTKPWTIHYPYKLDKNYPIYEYACHEGNYMMLDALSGAREMEKQGRTTASPASTGGAPGGGRGAGGGGRGAVPAQQ